MQTESFGTLTQLFCSFCSGKYPTVKSYLLDFAIHHFDLARHIAGADVSELSVFHNEVDGQGAFAVAVEYTNGAVGSLQLTSQRLWQRNYDYIEITGQHEYIVLDGLWGAQHFTENGNYFYFKLFRSAKRRVDRRRYQPYRVRQRNTRRPRANLKYPRLRRHHAVLRCCPSTQKRRYLPLMAIG